MPTGKTVQGRSGGGSVVGFAPFAAQRAYDSTLLVFDSFTNNTGSEILLVNHTPDTTIIGGWQEGSTNEASVLTTDILSLNVPNTNSYFVYFDVSAYLPCIMESKQITENMLPTRIIDVDNFLYVFAEPSVGQIRVFEFENGSATLRADSGTIPTFSTAWVADDGDTISSDVDRGSGLISYTSTIHNSSADFGVKKASRDREIDNFQLVGGTTDPAELRDLP